MKADLQLLGVMVYLCPRLDRTLQYAWCSAALMTVSFLLPFLIQFSVQYFFFVFGTNPEDFTQISVSFKYFLPRWEWDWLLSPCAPRTFPIPRDCQWVSPAVLVLGPVSPRSEGRAERCPPAPGRARWQPRNRALRRGRNPVGLWAATQWTAAGNGDDLVLCGCPYAGFEAYWKHYSLRKASHSGLADVKSLFCLRPCQHQPQAVGSGAVFVPVLTPVLALASLYVSCWASTYRWNNPKNVFSGFLLRIE